MMKIREGDIPLPAMTPLEKKYVALARYGRTTCSLHLVDLGLIDPSDEKSAHAAFKRVANRMGLKSDGWLPRLGSVIYGSRARR